jgi:hypothetical protein
MNLRTFSDEPVRGEITTDFPVSQDSIPILPADGQPFSPEEAEFFLESATPKEMKMLEEGEEGYEEVEEIDSDDD